MAASRKSRWIVLLSASILTLFAVLNAGKEDDTLSAAVAAATPVRRIDQPELGAVKTLPQIRLSELRKPVSSGRVQDVFAGQAWRAPAKPRTVVTMPVAPPAVAIAPAPPSAPAMPFTYFGKMIDDEQILVFLGKQDRSYAVKSGDIIDETYRIEEIKPPMMTLTYLPLNIAQTIQIGDSK